MELDPNEHALHNAPFLWRTPEPKKSYEAIIVGGGLVAISIMSGALSLGILKNSQPADLLR